MLTIKLQHWPAQGMQHLLVGLDQGHTPTDHCTNVCLETFGLTQENDIEGLA